MSPDLLRARFEAAAAANQRALRERLARAAVVPPPPDFAETLPGLLVAELDDLPDDAIDLMQVVREVEGKAS